MSQHLDLRLGVDVGGTNTDAVIVDRAGAVVAKAKVATTSDVGTGIADAIARVTDASPFESERITHAMLGTTQITNAVLQRQSLDKVGVIRIGAPATQALPPMVTWPDDLRTAVSAGAVIVGGGFEFDGSELAPLDEVAIRDFVRGLDSEVLAVAVSCVFAPVSSVHEEAAAKIIGEERPDVKVVLSHELGTIGILERENSTILNASLMGRARAVVEAFEDALGESKLDTSTFFVQNDGTLMSLEYAVKFPVLTIGSGLANSLRGAAYLTGTQNAVVIDVGGTSTDIGVLVNGFPRQSSSPVDIGGVVTNFRMPDVLSIALGGGSMVTEIDDGVQVGPRSVGHRLTEEALAFGGSVVTLTDAAVADGRADLGSCAVAASDLLRSAMAAADERIADAIDRMKVSRDAETLIIVGGGSVLIADQIVGISEISRPDHFDVANAVGAAIASVSGHVDRLFTIAEDGRKGAVDEATAAARQEAIHMGADPERVEIVDIEEIAISYLMTPVLRIRAKAAGPLLGTFLPDSKA